MSSKKKNLVRLANGAVETSDSVADIVQLVRSINSNMPEAMRSLALFVRDGDDSPVPDYVAALCRRERLVQDVPGFVLYDDVKDVLQSLIEWRGRSFRLRASPLHENQGSLRQ